MTKCFFCGREEYDHKGVHFIRNTGVVQFFCSSKCRKNSTKLKRDKRKLKWTEAFHETRTKGIEREALVKAEREKPSTESEPAKVKKKK